MNASPQRPSLRPHYPVTVWAMVKVVFWFFYEVTVNVPRLISLRHHYKKRQTLPHKPTVALIGDNLDEINGIAITSRSLVRAMRHKGFPVYLIGVAFHNKKPRMETERGGIFMVPGRCSMEQPGYKGSETAVPRLGLLLRLLRRNPVDLFEFETPNTVCHMALLVAKVVGIKTVQHYRTDIPAYVKLLVKDPIGRFLLPLFVKNFSFWAGPAIVPSEYFRHKVERLGVPKHKIFKLPRGVDLVHFHPNKKSDSLWTEHGSRGKGIRLLYVGRVSEEKNLTLFPKVFPKLFEKYPNLNLTIVGDGPYLQVLKGVFKTHSQVAFPGVLRGQVLAGIFASADIFVFPSLTDTFGNSVIEALASGVPCVVSNKGGPQEIIQDGISGLIFDSNELDSSKPNSFSQKLERLIQEENIKELEGFKAAARLRALEFTFDHSAEKFYEFYRRLV